jgi:hypothetical protein
MIAWPASFFNGGGALLAVACTVMMGLLVWLVIALTATGQRPAAMGERDGARGQGRPGRHCPPRT